MLLLAEEMTRLLPNRRSFSPATASSRSIPCGEIEGLKAEWCTG